MKTFIVAYKAEIPAHDEVRTGSYRAEFESLPAKATLEAAIVADYDQTFGEVALVTVTDVAEFTG